MIKHQQDHYKARERFLPTVWRQEDGSPLALSAESKEADERLTKSKAVKAAKAQEAVERMAKGKKAEAQQAGETKKIAENQPATQKASTRRSARLSEKNT